MVRTACLPPALFLLLAGAGWTGPCRASSDADPDPERRAVARIEGFQAGPAEAVVR